MESGELIIHYFNNLERDEFKIIENNLLSFLNSICFNVKMIDYQIDEGRQNFEIFKQKQFEELKKEAISSKKDDPYLTQVASDNKITTKTTLAIKDLEVGLSGVIVEGQIFDIKVNEKHVDHKKIYQFSITDYTSGIVIKAFESVSSADMPK
jgi:hypothetical protein